MKTLIRFFTFFTIISIATTLKAQDTLYMKSGEKIASQVVEVSPKEIKYKKADNLDGPLYTTPNSEISSIRYKNGTVETIKSQKEESYVKTNESARVVDPHPPIFPAGPFYKSEGRRFKEKDMYNMVREVNDSEINMHVKKAKNAKGLQNIGFVAIPAFAFGVGYTLYTALYNLDGTGKKSMSYAPGVAGVVLAAAAMGTSITFSSIRKKHNKAAVKLYNEKY